jgi:hypothetical protein
MPHQKGGVGPKGSIGAGFLAGLCARDTRDGRRFEARSSMFSELRSRCRVLEKPADLFSILLNVSGRPGRRRDDDCQNTVAELPSVILRRSSWLSKKIMPRSVPVSYRRFTSVSKPVQLQNLTGPTAICPGVRSSEP